MIKKVKLPVIRYIIQVILDKIITTVSNFITLGKYILKDKKLEQKIIELYIKMEFNGSNKNSCIPSIPKRAAETPSLYNTLTVNPIEKRM